MSTTETGFLPEKLKKLQSLALTGGVAGVVLSLIAWQAGVVNFYQGYLVGWLFAMGFALGGLMILCVHHLAHGGWGFLIRRIAESSAMTLPWIMVLFLPILLSLEELYPWATETMGGDASSVVKKKTEWLNVNGMWIRQFIYAAIWIGGAMTFWKWSGKQDESGSMVYRRKMRALAGPLVLVYVLTVTFWAVDVVMALEPMWFSSIIGVMFACGHMLTILTTGILLLTFLSRWEPIKSEFTVTRQHDLGKLLFAFVVFWAYVEVSQLIIYWHANIPEEVTWYANRWHKDYNWASWLLVFSQFIIPFLVLLSQGVKRNTKALAIAAGFLLLMRVVDLWWIVSPSITMPVTNHLYAGGETTAMLGTKPYHWMDIVGPLSFGLLWFGLFLKYFRQRPILPLNDPYFSHNAEIKDAN